MHKAPESEADELLKTLTQVYDESIKNLGANVTDDDEGDAGELSAEDAAEFAGDDVDDVDTRYFETDAATDKITKRTINTTMFKNPWKCGEEAFAKKNNVVDVRGKALEVRRKKAAARKAILNGIAEEETGGDDVVFGMEVDGLPHWRLFTNSIDNNLGLQ